MCRHHRLHIALTLLLPFLPAPAAMAGGVESEGGIVTQATRLRQLVTGSDGTGIRIGVVSDSYNRLGGASADVASGDLPANVTVLSEGAAGGTDEGRAMLQVIHDLAPGATLAFAAAGVSEATAAQAIRDLADIFQADVIVDSMSFPREPFFQDGLIAQAIDDVVQNSGVAYFSAAGNLGNQAFELTSAPSTGSENFGAAIFGISSFPIANALDLDPGAGTDLRQSITLNSNQTAILVLQWDNPFFSSVQTDLDVYLVDQTTNQLVAFSTADSTLLDEPVETISFKNTSGAAKTYEIIIDRFSGSTPNRIKWVNYGAATDGVITSVEYATNSPTITPHAASANAMAVAAVNYFDQRTAAAATSRGPATILFSANGTPIPPTERAKPDLTGVDGVNTTFFGGDFEADGRPNFFGTAAAASHAAAVAALVLQANPTFQPAQLYARLKATAADLGTTGADSVTGSGLVNAFTAVQGPATPASVPLTENFDAGLNARWEINSSNSGRVLVKSLNGDSNQQMLMDTFFAVSNSLNEAVLHFDATSAGSAEIELAFREREFGDEDHPMPATFTDSSNSDGVALSVDGVNWYRLVSLTGAASTSTFRDFKFNLTQFARDNGLVLGTDVRVKFQQYDNFPINSDGIAFDDVVLREPPAAPTITVDAKDGSFTAGEVASFSFTATGSPAVTVQWQVSTDGGATFEDIPGATSSTLTFNATLADNGQKYRAVLTNSEGTVNTAIATLTVTEAPSLTVTTTSDTSTAVDGLTSLREAIAYAKTLGGAQTIRFNGDPAALPKATGTGIVDFHDGAVHTLEAGSTLLINNQILTITGSSADRLILRNLGNVGTLLGISNASTVELSGMTVTGAESSGISSQNGDLTLRACVVSGNATDSDNTNGGGIYNVGGDLTLVDSSVSDNAVQGLNRFGGGIYHYGGTAILKNSTVSGNSLNGTANNYGAGIYNDIGGTLILVNSTVSGNSSNNGNNVGGAIYSVGTLELTNCTVTDNSARGGFDLLGGIANIGTAHIRNSIISGNTGGTTPDLVGSPATDSNNLIGDQPDLRLAPLGDYGGSTMTHALLPGSSAIDAGDNDLAVDGNSAPLTSDQRGTGFSRIVRGVRDSLAAVVDIGAFELFAAPEFLTDEIEIQIDGKPLDLATATGVSPSGGVFSGPGVSAGFFDPRTQMVGSYEITYTYTGDFGIINTSTLIIDVIADGGSLLLQKAKAFPLTQVGRKSKVQRLSLTNRGDLPVSGIRLVLRGAGRKDFKITQPVLKMLAPLKATTYRVSFHPKKPGSRRATVMVVGSGATTSGILKGKGATGEIQSPRDPDRVFPD